MTPIAGTVSGMGLDTACAFARAGAAVTLADVNKACGIGHPAELSGQFQSPV
jgi:NAD(P)-dependent dehydrogenase (short-subunit alcohol dehydrogenase family)